MGYKFGQQKTKIIIEIEGKEYPVILNGETAAKLERFGEKATEISKNKNVDFVDTENILLDFIESMIGVDETAEIIDSMPNDCKNAFEFMALAGYITDQIKEQGEQIGRNQTTPRAVRKR